uniref:Uncharacterized protein n=1 Tax=Anguilla anguilla TaxID=7936 RepID=A0A0E9RP59_ANGAN
MVHQQMHILYLMQNILCEFKVNNKLKLKTLDFK